MKGQLNHSDLRQYVNQMKNQITELKNEVGLARGLGAFVTDVQCI